MNAKGNAVANVDLLKSAYISALEYLPRLVNAFKKISEDFRTGLDGAAIHLFIEAQDGLNWISQLIDNSQIILSENQTIGELHNRYAALLQEVLTVFENEDFVTVGDLLEYELVPFFAEWDAVMTRFVNEAADGSANNS